VILENYQALRPCLWHLTTRDNWIGIRKRADGGNYVLSSTAALHGQAESPGFGLAEPRKVCESLTLPWGTALIRDQAQLVNAEKRLTFPEGWDLGRYCGWLNEFIFFWPGTQDAPTTTAGKKHFRYHLRKSEVKLTFLKLDAEKVLRRHEQQALFSQVSSGAPAGRKKSVARGPGIFVTASEINVPSDVVEVAFREELSLAQDQVIPVAESRMRQQFGLEE
jgi:hypothetical protein